MGGGGKLIFLTQVDIQEQLIKSLRGLNENGAVQQFIDSEVIRLMEPYTPFRDGTLKGAPQSQSQIGSGVINQQLPYARRWYYTPANFSGAPMRGTKWFERMKADHRDSILRGAAQIAGAKT